MKKHINVMLVDDSSTMRRLIKTALKSEPKLKFVYEAKDGQDAVKNVAVACPDIVVMDVEMPVMDGIVATREIRRHHPSLPIVMFSSLTSRGAEATLDALAAGANDFAVKPAAAGHITNAIEQLKENLLPKILELVTPTLPIRRTVVAPRTPPQITNDTTSASKNRIDSIAIGVSTGGPDALAKLLMDIPKNLPVPILITQHMPPVFTSLLATRLTSRTGHSVKEAVDGEIVGKGNILLSPGDYHLTVKRSGVSVHAKLDQEPKENSCRPAVDPLFRSMATCYGKNAMGIVLTGMGQDGAQGSGAIKSQGGSIIVQDKDSSVIWGMPGKVVSAGHADQILPLNQIAQELVRRVFQSLSQPAT
ncbi:MAG: chemotaxis response regulator protein-glutamate methylesterase [Mariniblastus sp.]